jgi:2-polyprenyl-3-methyl-5-hydroxy-6-metoxy-1,4-benzoquinol methylase
MKDDGIEESQICNPLNKEAWNNYAYEAWIHKFGTPKECASKISNNPNKSLAVILDKFGNVKDKKIANLMGSNGTKAVALSLLGAKVTVFDYSEGSKNYALELANEANVTIQYALENVLDITKEELTGDYDIVFAEIGILHYFTDLTPFFTNAYSLLKPGGRFILRDFHPVSNKLLTSRGSTAKIRKHKVTGDYFDTTLVESDISFAKYVPELATEKVFLRKWNLGDIITAEAKCNLIIECLDEEPNLSCEQYDKGIPKTFTLTARK